MGKKELRVLPLTESLTALSKRVSRVQLSLPLNIDSYRNEGLLASKESTHLAKG